MPGECAFSYIGTIRSPHKAVVGMPIQSPGAAGLVGRVEMRPDLVDGLKDLEGFSHVILIYHLHRAEGYSLEVVPFLDDASHGIFATRSPRRPNAIGISVVRLLSVQGSSFRFANPDMLDGAPR